MDVCESHNGAETIPARILLSALDLTEAWRLDPTILKQYIQAFLYEKVGI